MQHSTNGTPKLLPCLRSACATKPNLIFSAFVTFYFELGSAVQYLDGLYRRSDVAGFVNVRPTVRLKKHANIASSTEGRRKLPVLPALRSRVFRPQGAVWDQIMGGTWMQTLRDARSKRFRMWLLATNSNCRRQPFQTPFNLHLQQFTGLRETAEYLQILVAQSNHGWESWVEFRRANLLIKE